MGSLPKTTSVHTTLNYYLPPSRGGVKEFYPGTASNYRRKHDVQPVEIHDMRCADEEFSLDVQGFQLVRHASVESEFEDVERIRSVVYTETAELLKTVTGASAVRPISHIVRRQGSRTVQAAVGAPALDDSAPIIPVPPARYVHVDQSDAGAAQLLVDNVGAEEAPRLAAARWAIVNVWRPIGAPVRREPLAVCDARTVDAAADLWPVTARLPAKGSGSFENVSCGPSFETWQVAANPGHRWFYAERMLPAEALLIKIFDSKRDGRARGVPHTAFETESDEGPPRQSIEVRCLVFWEDQSLE